MTRQIVYAQGLGEAFAEEMARDERVFILGIDVQRAVFGVTAGLVDQFGRARVRNTPICESGIVGTALGAALTGLRPCAEIMFSDFTFIAMDQIANQVASWNYMTGGQWKAPMVIYTFDGAGMGLGYNHSQCTETVFQSIPGLTVVAASDAYTAKGLMKAAIRSEDPVLFFAHKALLGMPGEVPEEDYTVPLARARVVREGSDVTVVAHHLMLHHSLAVADALAGDGVAVEVIDPVCISPIDKETLLASVRKTGRLVTVEESRKVAGVGAEIAAVVCEEAFYDLDAPVKRVGAPAVPVPGSWFLEQNYVPGPDSIREAITSVL
ncbi:MAG: alpha-ketoacid dehydrogenase subunit beta [Ardenticatenaceae bacterium]|nr:alpha-ketoacid dehydrogenase subunit beta [Ardenticatenaceae bacterium]HBY93411.1 alpha-ketoacid dehydrogenase subunit beta [Chloroflexota bacterium]